MPKGLKDNVLGMSIATWMHFAQTALSESVSHDRQELGRRFGDVRVLALQPVKIHAEQDDTDKVPQLPADSKSLQELAPWQRQRQTYTKREWEL